MEFLLAVSVLITLNELREWRFSKHVSKLNDSLEKVLKELEEVSRSSKITQSLIESSNKNFSVITDEILYIRQAAEKSEANSATILKEYELNGIPLGYQRKNPDFIEGL